MAVECDGMLQPVLAGSPLSTNQERTEENEWDEVEVGKVTPALLFTNAWSCITGALTQTGKHNLMPGFTSGTPARDTMMSWVNKVGMIVREYSRLEMMEKVLIFKLQLSQISFITLLSHWYAVCSWLSAQRKLRDNEHKWKMEMYLRISLGDVVFLSIGLIFKI